MAEGHDPARGLTSEDVARRYRVSPDKVRSWIKRGDLAAVNTATAKCAKPRYVVPPEALATFERQRSAAAPPKPAVCGKRSRTAMDYFP